MRDYAADDYVEKALGVLIDILGVKEEVEYTKLEVLFQEKEIEVAVKAIAFQLGLPIDINIEYGEKNIQSEGLARTDANGRGIEGVIAQVRIPPYLPRFGSSELTNYPIQIFIGPDYRNQIPTLMAIIVHELAHVLLHSLRSQYSHDEIYTDLVGPMLGLTSVIEKGRKTIKTLCRDNAVCTETTTFGYLSDEQFISAKEKIREVLQDRKEAKTKAKAEISELIRLCIIAEKQISEFKNSLEKIDNYPKNRISQEEAIRLVSFHQTACLDELMDILRECENHIKQVSSFIKATRHYTKNKMVEYENIQRRTELNAANVLSKTASLNEDIELMRKRIKLRGKLLG